jgi:hypothetical protein
MGQAIFPLCKKEYVFPCPIDKHIVNLSSLGLISEKDATHFSLSFHELYQIYTEALHDQKMIDYQERKAKQKFETGFGETTLRDFLEKKFNTTFGTIWHKQIINPKTSQPLQLDCYSEELKLAFEYNGAQHYQPVELFGGQEAFEQQKYRDDIKRERCKQLGIRLVEIDERKFSTHKNKKRKQIKEFVDEFYKTYRSAA